MKDFGMTLLCLVLVAGGVLMGAFGVGASVGWIPFVLGVIVLIVIFIFGLNDIANGTYLFASICLLVGGIAMAVFGLPVAWLPTLIGFAGTLVKAIGILG